MLVNNAGMGMLARFEDVTDLSLYERLMRVNYLGSVYPTFYALPHLKRSRGQIVAVSSLAGLNGVPHAHRVRGDQARADRLLRLAAHRAARTPASP